MANIRLIRRRIRSIQSTSKITKAMEMIATSKMRRTQMRALEGRPYADMMREVLADLAAQPCAPGELHPMLQRRPVKNVSLVHITSDRGLCGGLNSNMNRRSSAFIIGQAVPVTPITVGRKGRDFMRRHRLKIRAEFTSLGDRPSLLTIAPIARVISEDYMAGLVDEVYLGYNRFVSVTVQRPVVERLLPVEPATLERHANVEYIYEPSGLAVLAELLPRFVEMQVYHAILEAIASEQSARMVAMRNATDNAHDMIRDLTLSYNKARQDMITKEILDIVGGAAALE